MSITKEGQRNALVFVRVLPSADMCHDFIRIEKNLKVMYVRCLQDLGKASVMKTHNYWRYETDGILYNASQEDAYSLIMDGVLERVIRGCNAVIFAYGQTGAGKSFTMAGLNNEYLHRGLAPRIISDLFYIREARKKDLEINYHISFIEICGNLIQDLLESSPTFYKGQNFIQNVSVLPINSEEEALRLIFQGEGNRSTLASAPYKSSNQGHSIITIYTQCSSLVSTEEFVTSAKIHMVDMAGVDSYGNPASHWKSQKDVSSANLNKSLLEQFLAHLSVHPPSAHNKVCFTTHRISYLIHYLGDCLSQQSMLRFVGHIRGGCRDLTSTLSTLRFGERIGGLKCSHLKFNILPQQQLITQNLKEQVRQLSDQLLLMGMLADQPSLINISQAQVEQTQRMAMDYLNGQDTELTIMSVGQVTVTLQVFKDLYNKSQQDKEQLNQKLAELIVANEEAEQHKAVKSSPTLIMSRGKGKRTKREEQQHKREELQKAEEAQSQKEPSSPPQQSEQSQLVGETDRAGIGIGSGIIASNEGSVTRATKRQRLLSMTSSSMPAYRRSSKAKIKETDESNISVISSGEPILKQQISKEILEEDATLAPLPQVLPSRDEAWQIFTTNEKQDFEELQHDINIQNMATVFAHKTYLTAASQLAEAKMKLNTAKEDLSQAQHKRHMLGEEVYDSEGRVIISQEEQDCLHEVMEHQEELTQIQEKVTSSISDLETKNLKLAEIKNKLEETFQAFCTKTYYTPLPQVDEHPVQLVQILMPEVESIDKRCKEYQDFQRTFLKKERPQPKKKWV